MVEKLAVVKQMSWKVATQYLKGATKLRYHMGEGSVKAEGANISSVWERNKGAVVKWSGMNSL